MVPADFGTEQEKGSNLMKGRAEVTRGGEVVGTVRYTVHVDAWGHVTGNIRDVEWLIKPTEGPRILNSPVVSQDFLPKGPSPHPLAGLPGLAR